MLVKSETYIFFILRFIVYNNLFLMKLFYLSLNSFKVVLIIKNSLKIFIIVIFNNKKQKNF